MTLDSKELKKRIVGYRRDFHKHAEVKWTEFRTSCKVAQRLVELGIEVKMGLNIVEKGLQFSFPSEEVIQREIQRAIDQGANEEIVRQMDNITGVVGIIDTKKEGPVVAFRFDMDALTIVESNEDKHFPKENGFRSINEGYCHACGHDGHTAIGLGVAEVLMSIKDTLTGKIKLIFQPSEEGGGGARGIVKKGVLDDVDYFFAGHIGLTKLDGLPLKSRGIICGTKDFLDNRRYNITYNGKAAHPCGDPHVGKNALLAASTAALNVHSIAPHSEGMMRVNVGILKAGISRNTIAPNAYLEIEIRGENDTVAEYGEDKMLSIVKGVASVYQLECEIEHVGTTYSAKSDDEAIDFVMNCAKEIPWFKEFELIGSVGGTDDASDMIRRVQKNGGIGTYIGLGADFTAGFHNSSFDFDESILLPSVELFVKLVQQLQNRK
ncbi:MAG: amidohydrolase [Tepidibacter sp.]|uniref:amidohydrolase n=1 Tax=Tepidibacter sp. TaxID=2529387 RepID=UPI0025EC60D7|nr:amidohydrolase [Tepidibacter sp.]MCT4509564.1 amidohydrolase [Tepidibacter sp.]